MDRKSSFIQDTPQQESKIPFLNPFSDEYYLLKNELIYNSYKQNEIEKSIIAGCNELNECSKYIDNLRCNKPNNQSLTYPGFNIDILSTKQRLIFNNYSQITNEETGETPLDTVKVLYVLLYTGTDNDDELLDYYENSLDGKSIPPEANSQEINFSDELNHQQSSSIEDQEEMKKDIQKIKQKQYDDIQYKMKVKQMIKKQRESLKRENETPKNSKSTELLDSNQNNSLKETKTSQKAQNNTVSIRFRLPDGKLTDHQFDVNSTFEDIEKKLKENKNVDDDDDSIEFTVLPSQKIGRDDFKSTLKEKKINGKIMMSVISKKPQPLPPPPKEPKEKLVLKPKIALSQNPNSLFGSGFSFE